MSKDVKRDDKIKQWRTEGKTQQQIADLLSITRQRVQQLERKLKLPPRERYPGRSAREHKCKECSMPFKNYRDDSVYCSVKCSAIGRRIYKTAEARRRAAEKHHIRMRQRAKKFYYEVFKKNPRWKEIVKARNQKAAKRKLTKKK